MSSSGLTALNLPEFPFKLKSNDQGTKIFDPIRKKYLVLTPEEWVRQNFVQFLINQLQYISGLIEIEKGLRYNTMSKRADVVVNNRQGKPVLIVECKAPSVKIKQEVFDQAARYNHVFKVPYLIVTNGLEHYCCKIDHERGEFEFVSGIPTFDELNQ